MPYMKSAGNTMNYKILALTLLLTGCAENYNTITDASLKIEQIFNQGIISCESSSMAPTMNCNDKIYFTEDKLIEGQIYVYESGNGNNTVHRLVKDCRKGCYGLIFKGDYNLIADDIVQEEQIRGRVTSVTYR